MGGKNRTRAPTMHGPANYRIQVHGRWDGSWSDQQRALTEATATYLAGTAEQIRSAGAQPALPYLKAATQELVQKWKALCQQEDGVASFYAKDVRSIRTSIERRALLSDSLHEFADWLAAQTSPSAHSTELAGAQREG